MRHILSLLAFALVLALLGSACAGARDPDPAEGAPGEAISALGDFESGSIGGTDFGELGGSDFGHLDLGHLDLGGSSSSPSSGDRAADEQGIGITEITCPPPERGVECMARCAQHGINCAGARPHPFKSGSGLGLLGKGQSVLDVTSNCWYYYPNGDMCMFPRLHPPMCEYTTCPR
jgi:hypothetical protein